MAPAQGDSTASGSYSSMNTASPGFWRDEDYLTYMRTLVLADASAQKKLYQQANAEYDRQETAHTRLRLALTLSLLSPPQGDTTKANKLFKELASTGQSLPPTLHSIVQVQLAELKRRQALEEKLDLQLKELDEAKAKLEALTTIERTLEQPIPETKTKAVP